MGLGFQYSHFLGQSLVGSTLTTSSQTFVNALFSSNPNAQTFLSGNLFGGDLQIGYKYFFGKKKRFGMRFYGFFSGQGIGSSPSLPSSQASANLFYGVGLDMLLNFYDNPKANHFKSFGMLFGVMAGGSSWFMGKGYDNSGNCLWQNQNNLGIGTPTCTTMDQYFSQRSQSTNQIYQGTAAATMPTFVQLIVNVGLRANFKKHRGLEFGVRIPIIADPYYVGAYDAYGVGMAQMITLKRNIAAYINYVHNF
ncbi:hypothetical protein NHP190012_04830 [Helicobacter sp. NHP19-012]|uniref:Outer membrane protein n=1 Tax=Helicobacter gastrofelis TaxID=2849642 RepID=A0ABN6I5F0_9HELI|nr:outer membrane protein [Helicobacter sp. NHP19-012]BCZ18841.1 hypothetical protein NHP190012_04830 [Helicobacter sp. NHP19-012]